MQRSLPLAAVSLALTTVAAPAADAQTEVLLRIDRPAGTPTWWGSTVVDAGDLDQDGVPDLVVGITEHGGGQVATAVSGSDGSLLWRAHAPNHPMFFGQSIGVVADQTGDGVPEVLLAGTQSWAHGSPDGFILVRSGADGSRVRELVPPAGSAFTDRRALTVVDDHDGDGSEDVLMWTRNAGVRRLELVSSKNGARLATIDASPGSLLLHGHVAIGSDHDGDGFRDVLLLARDASGHYAEVRSTADGALLGRLDGAAFSFATGNGEPFASISDLDGDGLRDLAVGSIFLGHLELLSTSDGSVLQEWDCGSTAAPCVASRLAEVGDLNGDGHPDLLAVESALGGVQPVRIYALDPRTGDVLFEESTGTLLGSYASTERITPIDGRDPHDFATFAVFEETLQQISVRRFRPEVGTRVCDSTANGTGATARLSAYGSPSVGVDRLVLELTDAPAGALSLFVAGTEPAMAPYGDGFLCVDGGLIRLAPGFVGADGARSADVELAAFGASVGSTWTFQAFFRDLTPTGFQTSDAVTAAFVD